MQHEHIHHVQIVKNKVRTLEAAKKRIPKRIAKANFGLKYRSLQYICKFSGEPRNQDATRKCHNKSFCFGCPFEIFLELSQDNQSLEVLRFKHIHNHMVTREFYEHLPKQIALPQDLMNEVKEAITLKANIKLCQQKIEASSGKKFILKDIANLRQYSKVSFSGSEIKNIAESVVDILVDHDKNFKEIFFQDLQMQKVYEKFPEILLVDATYKLLELRMPIYLLIAIDGDGQSEIAVLFIFRTVGARWGQGGPGPPQPFYYYFILLLRIMKRN